MEPAGVELMGALGTALLTAFLTSYATAKANERVLRSIINRLDDLEERMFEHEKRISRLEGSVRA